MAHIPVLLNEVLQQLDPKPGQFIIDATAGEGGHAIAFAKMVSPTGRVLAVDWDPVELSILEEKVEEQHLQDTLIVCHGNFKNLGEIVQKYNFPAPHAVLFDLGFSSWHIEHAGRGFSFARNEPLDMRYDPNDMKRPTAAQIVNTYRQEELEQILREYGEESFAKKIAAAVVQARKYHPFQTTQDLVLTVSSVVRRRGKLHPATKTFQALRIAVNEELENVRVGLDAAKTILCQSGYIAVITFHSLEDRIIKNMFRGWEGENFGKNLTRKVIKPQYEEIKANPRARSAKLRVFQKL